MSAKHPNILYVGNPERANSLAKAVNPDGWHVYIPDCTMQALAFHIFYMPDLIIIDNTEHPQMSAEAIRETYEHLISVDAEPVLLLADDYMAWDIPVDLLNYSLALNSNLAEMIDTVAALIEEKFGEAPVLTYSTSQ